MNPAAKGPQVVPGADVFRVHRTNSHDPAFKALVAELDHDLAVRDGKDHGFYATFNTLDAIRHAVVVFVGDRPVACGAFKRFAEDAVEIKRMFTLPALRGKGLGTRTLSELEQWARELGRTRCVLETGRRQPEAIALYTDRGYATIPNYGPYVGVANSVCMEKRL
ncbi:MAG: GNAT family N-acetyltransferase [Flavobacteriales bacterium]|nr:GNAT family N-acetyltransferase [Flavobacteriales bacterium]MCB9166076.1 GNAT family N-acetyltransferase [Flavobacteriales bacterium]